MKHESGKRARKLHRGKPADSEVQSQVSKDGSASSRTAMHRKEKTRRSEEASFSRKTENSKKRKRRRNSASSRKTDQQNSKAWRMATRVHCKTEASRIRRTIAADRSANDIAKQMTMTRKRERVIITSEEKKRVTVTKSFCRNQMTERETQGSRTDDTPAVLDEPTDHAVARSRDVSHRNEGGHSQENHAVVLEWCWKPPTDRSGNDLSD